MDTESTIEAGEEPVLFRVDFIFDSEKAGA